MDNVTPAASAAIMKPDMLVVDINGLGYAAMYSPVGKLTHNGFPTGGVHGALTSLFSRMGQRRGAVPFVLWDRKAHWRHEEYEQYKSNRGATPEKVEIRESYRKQVPIIQMVLQALGIPQISCGEAEADDLAGVLCRHIDPSWLIELITRDTDWYQGLARNIAWYSPLNGKQVSLADLSDPNNGLSDGHFLSTWEFLQAMAVAGDASDCIDGVEKVGMTTAVKHMRANGGSMESFWAACDSGACKVKGVILERLANQESRDIYKRNLRLMDWTKAPEIRNDLLAFTAGEPDWDQVKEIAAEYGLAKMVARAQDALEHWRDGWGSAIHAVEAALNYNLMQPVVNPRPQVAPSVEVAQSVGKAVPA